MKNNAKMTKEEYLEAAWELDYTDWRIQENLQRAEEIENRMGKPFEDYGIFVEELFDMDIPESEKKEDFEKLLRNAGRYGHKSFYFYFKWMYEKKFGIPYNLEEDVARYRDTHEKLGKLFCPVCGKYEFEEEGDYDICEICRWENDQLQTERPDYAGGANIMSLNQARKAYQEGRRLR